MQTLEVDSSQAGSTGRERMLAAEQIRVHYRNMPGAFIGSAVTASFMVAALYDKLSDGRVLLWLAAAYVNSGIRLALWKGFWRANPTAEAMSRWGRYAVWSSALAGVVWGSSGIALNMAGNFAYQTVVLLLTTGLAFASTYLSSSFLPAYRAFAYPVFVLSAYPFLLGGDPWHVVIGLGTLGFLPLVLRYAAGLSRAWQVSSDVRLQNVELVEELRAQKKAAEEANIAKSRFLAVTSHDLRQPLHALTLFVQALEDTPLPADAQQLVGNVRRSVDSMEELFEALLDISRLDAGAVKAHVETLALAEVFERVAFEYAAVAHQKGLMLRVIKTSVYVRSDPTLLARIVRNLVANAVRYTDRGRVTIGCRRRGDQVRIEVWDTGPGIPPEKRAEVFQEFTQLGSPDRDRRKGLGLGLAIVERLGKLMGHTIELDSKPGRGSMFAVTLPRGQHEERDILNPVGEIAARFDLKGRLALLIHGERGGREALRDLLADWNCDVITAASGGEMMAQVAGLYRRPDFIVVDCPTLGEGGASVVEMLRDEFNADVPALLVTAAGAPAPADGREGLPVLQRPFNAGRLRTLINNLLHAPPVPARRAG